MCVEDLFRKCYGCQRYVTRLQCVTAAVVVSLESLNMIVAADE